ncbi:MAG TPA: hypothetical protein VJS14_10835, partial [Enterobacteriaceae bacterium]|nr:hypothetical protein [Enterobacteriaceae bacterium]
IMLKFLKKWIRDQVDYFIWTYTPIVLTIIVALLTAYFFPGYGFGPAGIFFLVMLVVMGYFSLRK